MTSTSIAITAEGLGKRYRIGAQHRKANTSMQAVGGLIASPFRYLRERMRSATEDEIFWALRDVSFEVARGEVVGVVGRNGAGKSTLLKMLSRITDPTHGHAILNGRVNALLEVGTGFHPELTGRENIYLSAAIHGMRRREVKAAFEEIVEFAGVSKFIDTPVKRYSSGMQVRLGFAVAAHLEPEILLVDEVLAVGDVAFQKKCLDRMGDVAGHGRTVLFVSHNLTALSSLCPKSLLLDGGRLVGFGPTSEILNFYLSRMGGTHNDNIEDRTDRAGSGDARIVELSISSEDGNAVVRSSDKLRIQVSYQSQKAIKHPRVMLSIRDHLSQGIYFLDSQNTGDMPENIPSSGKIDCLTGPINITPGRCHVNVALCEADELLDHVTNAAILDIVGADFHGTGKLISRQEALCLIEHRWECR